MTSGDLSSPGPLASEGPYRDLGSGFARLAGAEGARRAPSRILTVEDALAALVRNSIEAGAERVFVASSLRSRRYRTLTVIDDGSGLPEGFEERVFEPGVTSRHLAPPTDAPPRPPGAPHAAGLSLYHIREAAISAEFLNVANPTALRATFDTHHLPERTLQTTRHEGSGRPSRSNLPATLRTLLVSSPRDEPPQLYLASPSRILAALLQSHIIPEGEAREVGERARGLGLGVSLRTVQRVLAGRIPPAAPLPAPDPAGGLPGESGGGGGEDRRAAGSTLTLGAEETLRIQAILEDAARAHYLAVGPLRVESRDGMILLRASVYEPEEIYEDY